MEDLDGVEAVRVDEDAGKIWFRVDGEVKERAKDCEHFVMEDITVYLIPFQATVKGSGPFSKIAWRKENTQTFEAGIDKSDSLSGLWSPQLGANYVDSFACFQVISEPKKVSDGGLVVMDSSMRATRFRGASVLVAIFRGPRADFSI